jgi:hypothetical protein
MPRLVDVEAAPAHRGSGHIDCFIIEASWMNFEVGECLGLFGQRGASKNKELCRPVRFCGRVDKTREFTSNKKCTTRIREWTFALGNASSEESEACPD